MATLFFGLGGTFGALPISQLTERRHYCASREQAYTLRILELWLGDDHPPP